MPAIPISAELKNHTAARTGASWGAANPKHPLFEPYRMISTITQLAFHITGSGARSDRSTQYFVSLRADDDYVAGNSLGVDDDFI